MPYVPHFTITPALLNLVERVAALRENIQGALVERSWVPALRKDTRSRIVHASTAIEGNLLSFEHVRGLEEGHEPLISGAKAYREVMNYFAGLRFIEEHSAKRVIGQADIFALHRILAGQLMVQGEAGKYRSLAVPVRPYRPPASHLVRGLMSDLLAWWNAESIHLSPVLSSAILHNRFKAIHPFADRKGRAGRTLALWDLYRRGFDRYHIFAVDEYYRDDQPRYHAELARVHQRGNDLTNWLEYCAEGLRLSLEETWLHVKTFSIQSPHKLALRPKQEKLLHLMRDHGGLTPIAIWKLLGVSRQGAMDSLNPLLEAGLIEKIGGKRTGRYVLREL